MLNKSLRKTAYALAASAIGSGILVGCVDNDYDLSKDMDLNVTIGGEELNLPVCSTAPLTMKDILDIDENESSIKQAKQGEYGLNEGDYVLIQKPEGEPTTTDIKIDIVDIDESGLNGSSQKSVIEFPLLDVGDVEMPTQLIQTDMSLVDDNVDTQLKSVIEAETNVRIKVHVTFDSNDYNGVASIKAGTKAKFSDSWFLKINDPATAQFAKIVDDHTVEFTTDKSFVGNRDDNTGFDIFIDVIKFELGPNRGEGLWAPGRFDLQSTVDFEGHLAISNTESKPGQFATVELWTYTSVESASLRTVTGTVDPEINVDPTSVDINDIPDFLSDKKNNLDILNPQIKLDVTNSSPVEATISAIIIATYPAESQKEPYTIKIGDKYGKQTVKINRNGKTALCLTQTGQVESGYTPIVVDELSKMLATIPEHLEITDIDVKADDTTPVKFTLGDSYHFETDYEAVVPFQFGPDMELHYSTTADGWDTDLDSYNFDTVHLSMDIENTTPLGMTPRIVAIDENDDEIDDVTCTFIPADNSIKANSTSTISADLKSNTGNLGRMTGIRVKFEAKTGAEGAGKALNANQTLTLKNIKVSIRGGITVDLNEI